MALSQGVKDTVDAMSTVDKALLALYTAGHDDTSKAIDLGKAMVKLYWKNLDGDTLTNNQLALAILLATNDYWTGIYRAYKADEADITRQALIDAANEHMAQENPLGDMPEPPEE